MMAHVMFTIRISNPVAVVAALLTVPLAAQEYKRVPDDSVRISVPGCTKGLVFTAGPRTEDQPGRAGIPEGMHLRMNGPKKIMTEIKAHEGAMVEVTGLIKKGQYKPDGVSVGGGVSVAAGPSPGGSLSGGLGASQIVIDVEGWRQVAGSCPSR
jgi:hypothetical protein